MNKSSALSGVRNLADFRAMFALDDASLQLSIAVYPAGIGSFGAQMFQAGHQQVVSFDPYYDLSPMDMMKHVNFVLQDLSAQVNPDACAEDINQWQATSQLFLQDYSVGQKEGRYVLVQASQLTSLTQRFELALCPDLFADGLRDRAADIISAWSQLAKEVRVFPIQTLDGELYPELAPVMLTLQSANLGVELKEVWLPSQDKPKAMLRVWSKGCVVA